MKESYKTILLLLIAIFILLVGDYCAENGCSDLINKLIGN